MKKTIKFINLLVFEKRCNIWIIEEDEMAIMSLKMTSAHQCQEEAAKKCFFNIL